MAESLETDLQLTWRSLGMQSSDRIAVDLVAERSDLALVSGRSNLAQAIVNRLLTRQGELSLLGHPDYGSRLYLLVGEPQSRRTHLRAEFYVRESLGFERRISEVVSVTIAPIMPRSDQRSTLKLQVVVRPIDQSEPLVVNIAVALEG